MEYIGAVPPLPCRDEDEDSRESASLAAMISGRDAGSGWSMDLFSLANPIPTRVRAPPLDEEEGGLPWHTHRGISARTIADY